MLSPTTLSHISSVNAPSNRSTELKTVLTPASSNYNSVDQQLDKYSHKKDMEGLGLSEKDFKLNIPYLHRQNNVCVCVCMSVCVYTCTCVCSLYGVCTFMTYVCITYMDLYYVYGSACLSVCQYVSWVMAARNEFNFVFSCLHVCITIDWNQGQQDRIPSGKNHKCGECVPTNTSGYTNTCSKSVHICYIVPVCNVCMVRVSVWRLPICNVCKAVVPVACLFYAKTPEKRQKRACFPGKPTNTTSHDKI